MTQPTSATLLVAYDRKIQTGHHERLAVVYVRQSTLGQVQRHQESTQLQYGLVSTAERLGWPRQRVVVIDDDLGISGASAEDRLGFQRLLSEVALDHVGLILGVEMSRLARSCKDWYQLLELCALFGTLIGDLDGLYDPSCYNDRLLLGLKGTMSEAELHILKQRMRQGALQKARRGELVTRVPLGYVRSALGEVDVDPNEQVQAVVRLIFEQFERLGSVNGLLRHFVKHGIQLPIRVSGGPNKGQLEWRRANQSTVRNVLTNPMYAGAYAYGRTCQRKQARRQRFQPKRVPRSEWEVLLRDRYPAYISWAQYERNLSGLEENRSRHTSRGSVRKGRALLCGMVSCGRCGFRMFTQYCGSANQPRYHCSAARAVYGGETCQGLSARALDEEVIRLTLKALEPSALELSLQVVADLQKQREQTQAQWQQRLERAEYEADRTRRQYEAVEPENRLVARTLQAAWEEKLRAQRELVEQHERYLQEQPRVATVQEQAEIRRLAEDLPALWYSDTTTDVERKQILRQVIDKIEVNVEGETEWVEARIDWAGGNHTYTRFRRPVARMEQLSTWPQLRQRLTELKEAGYKTPRIVATLNQEGFRTAGGQPFTKGGVRTLLSRYQFSKPRHDRTEQSLQRGQDEWFVAELAKALQVSDPTIYSWIRRGVVTARQVGGRQGRWIITADAAKRRELIAYKEHQRRRKEHHEAHSEKAKV